jgi:hypothetical protein
MGMSALGQMQPFSRSSPSTYVRFAPTADIHPTLVQTSSAVPIVPSKTLLAGTFSMRSDLPSILK